MKTKLLAVGAVSVIALAVGAGTLLVLSDDSEGPEMKDGIDSDSLEENPDKVDHPTASISATESGSGVVEITHEGGGSLSASNVHVYVDGGGTDTSHDWNANNSGEDWETVTGDSDVTPASSVTVSVESSHEVIVTYENGAGTKIIAQSIN